MSPAMQWQREHWFATAEATQPTTAGDDGVVQGRKAKAMLRSRACARIPALAC